MGQYSRAPCVMSEPDNACSGHIIVMSGSGWRVRPLVTPLVSPHRMSPLLVSSLSSPHSSLHQLLTTLRREATTTTTTISNTCNNLNNSSKVEMRKNLLLNYKQNLRNRNNLFDLSTSTKLKMLDIFLDAKYLK